MAEAALSDVKIVELGGFVAAPYCTKLMADLGAEVIKIEEPGIGDAARRYGPFPGDEPHPERSLLFAYLNANKRGITLDVKNPLGRKIFLELLRDADILVESNPPKLMEELGLDYDSLSSVNEKLIVTSITPFGQTGPYRDYKATDLISFHMGGVAYATPGGVEDPENHPPLKAPGHQAYMMAAITGSSATMCAVMGRDLTGQGQHLDISVQEPLVRSMGNDVTSHTNKGETPIRIAGMGRAVGTRKPLPAKDGLFSGQFNSDRVWPSVKNAMGNPDWMDEGIFSESESRRDNLDAILLLIGEWSQNYTKEELYQIFQVENHIPCMPVSTLEDLLSHPHFQERGTFVEMDHPQIGKFKAPGSPYNFSATPWRITRSAPSLGQHNEEIFCGKLGYSKEDLVKMQQISVV